MTGNVASENIKWHGGELSEEDRTRCLGQKGGVVWLTGLSGSGKSTVARRAESLLVGKGVFCAVLDGDNLRHGLNRDLGFAPEDRAENIRRVSAVAALMCASNVVVITAFISPYRADRDAARAVTPAGRFMEVHMAATTEVCAARDPKGLYKKAYSGEIENFTGVSAPYEAPLSPELVLDTSEEDIEASAVRLVNMLEQGGYLGGKS